MTNANDYRFYIYEWYIIDSEKVFYVGKGTGKRKVDIASRNPDFKRLCVDFKTESRIVYNNLTEEITLLQQAIEKIGGMVYKLKSKNVKYMVEFDLPNYQEVIEKRNAGYKVIHSLDLIRLPNNGKPLYYQSSGQ